MTTCFVSASHTDYKKFMINALYMELPSDVNHSLMANRLKIILRLGMKLFVVIYICDEESHRAIIGHTQHTQHETMNI